MNKFFLMIFLIFNTLAKAETPSFKCKKNITAIEQSICRNLYLATLDSLLNEVYNLKTTKNGDQEVWLKKRSTDEKVLIDQYEARVKFFLENSFESLGKDATNLKELLGELKQENVFKYLYYARNSNKNFQAIKEDLNVPLDLLELSNANNIIYDNDMEFNPANSYHVLDFNNDGVLDLVRFELQGSLRVPYVYNMCFSEKIEQYDLCSKQWSDYFMYGKFKITSEEERDNFFENSSPADIFVGRRIFYLKGRTITENGFSIKNENIILECSLDWVQNLERINNYSKKSEIYKKCSNNENAETLIKLAIKEENFEICREVYSKHIDTVGALVKYKEDCFFSKVSQEKIDNLNFVDTCILKNKILDNDTKFYIESIFQHKGYNYRNKERDFSVCNKIFNEILADKKVEIRLCDIGDIKSLKFLQKLKGIKGITIIGGGQTICNGIGNIDLKDADTLDSLNLDRLNLDTLYLSSDENRSFWKYLENSNLKEVNFSNEYFCKYELKSINIEKIKSKNTNLTLKCLDKKI